MIEPDPNQRGLEIITDEAEEELHCSACCGRCRRCLIRESLGFACLRSAPSTSSTPIWYHAVKEGGVMALIPIAEAASQAGVSVQDIEGWAARGLIDIHSSAQQRCVDADQFHEAAESLGWLHVSGQTWDDGEEV